ncbi:MAG: flagellar basal body-associated FliL family protein [Candidatus Competibacteraceae bacterium]|uniref:Flagellar protein FliL n=1 Tax=Candidatus Contendobacter odensis Run_B_J11 TaxID=1400861 RepID=A0A7U7GEY2_9GAMM|nr:flagellar basal body-associated FliL family protein [Candidatus Contendobacter odensis]MBK8538279.1 flagellar basal body-associated FliL family protein [Candidatus Competibacteraceae bacterium]MBK8754190.1 flagellar basal body-associated FliL family protein [Candidatus Competibacteraceae bacterium]CDH47140.1 putative Flagellar basal body-associated protein FliL [Candidatus Contendobacter odensis Run_B_J11]
MKIVLIVVGVLILIGGSIGATLFLTGALNKSPEGQTQAAAPAHGAAPAPAHSAAPAPAHGAAAAGAAAIYQAIDPPFIVNFEDQGVLRYLQIGLAAQTRLQPVADAITANMPQIRNNLIMLFADQKLERLTTNEGKEQLRMQALTQIQAVLTKEIGYPGVDAVYFTIFVLQ